MKKSPLPFLLLGSLLVFSVFWVLNIKAEFDRAETEHADQTREYAGHLNELSDAVFEQYKNIFETLARTRIVKEQQPEETTALFEELKKAFPEIVNFAAVDARGRFFASGLPINRNNPPTINELYFFKNLAAGQRFTVMEPHIGPISTQRVTGIVVALTSTHNQFNGLVGATFPLEIFLSRWQEKLNKEPSFSIMVTDGNGKPFFANGPFFPKGMDTVEQSGYGDLANLQRDLQGDGKLTYAHYSRQSSLSNWTVHLISPPGIEFSTYIANHPTIVGVGVLLLIMLFWTSLLIAKNTRDSKVLRESEERFRQLAENIDAVFWICSPDMTSLLYVSPAFEAIWGVPSQQVYERPLLWLDYIHPEDRERVRQSAKRIKELGGYDEEYRVVQPSGKIRWIRDRAFALRDDDGVVYRIVGLASDITSGKESEHQKALLEEQLRQSQKIEAIGTLAGGIAHDFNNILAAILGYTELVHLRLEHESQNRKYLSEVLVAATRAKELVQQILAFSRKTAESRTPVPLHLVVGEVIRLLRQTLPTTIEIQLEIAKERDTVLADATQIHQVVMNLCTNSYQAMLEQGGILSVSLTNVEVSQSKADKLPDLRVGPSVLLTIQDTGIGMAPETLMRVFEPFFTTKPVGTGTGMGMSVVHGIVKSHGGAIGIESALGQGTKVEVYLPFYAGDIPRAQTNDHVPFGRGERIMVVDDEPALAKLTCKLMEEIGYSVECCTSSLEALKRIKENPSAYDLLISDQTMPEMTGINLARNVLAIRPKMPVLLCTGYSETVTEEQALKVGVVALLGKPLGRAVLAESVRKALDKTTTH
jgi:PAS domain S-box-containing protein